MFPINENIIKLQQMFPKKSILFTNGRFQYYDPKLNSNQFWHGFYHWNQRFHTDFGAQNQIPNPREGQRKFLPEGVARGEEFFDLPEGLEFDSTPQNPYGISNSLVINFLFIPCRVVITDYMISCITQARKWLDYYFLD